MNNDNFYLFDVSVGNVHKSVNTTLKVSLKISNLSYKKLYSVFKEV